MSTPELCLKLPKLSVRSALVSTGACDGPPEGWFLRDPLRGLVPANATPLSENIVEITLPEVAATDFPQIDVTGRADWAVWPNWRLAPQRNSAATPPDSESLAWKSTGLYRMDLHPPGNIQLEWPPGTVGAEHLARTATGILVATFGVWPWNTTRMLIEQQTRDLGLPKGLAVAYPSGMWCRVLLRPGAHPGPDSVEIIVHEFLHHLVEFDTPPGHALTEGLITYLARLLVVKAGIAPQRWLDQKTQRAMRELRQWNLTGMTLPVASARFFQSLTARRVCYRKGHLLFRDVDRACQGQLLRIVVYFATRRRRLGLPLTERGFVAVLPAGARRIYQTNCGAVVR